MGKKHDENGVFEKMQDDATMMTALPIPEERLCQNTKA
jgi:hypothetical protein